MMPLSSHERAYTYVDHGRALVGNRWMERRWSAFMGTTTGLWHRSAQRVWANVPGEEVTLTVNGEVQPALAFGDVAWSEEADSYGATLVQDRSGLGLSIEVRTFVFHSIPAMARVLTVVNRSAARPVGCTLLDELRLTVHGGEDPSPRPTVVPPVDVDGALGQAVALERPDGGLFVAVEAGGTIDLDAWDDTRVRLAGPVECATQTARVRLPVCWLCFYSGNTAQAGADVMRQALNLWRDRQAELDERAAEMRRGKEQ
jgi:hypothetical protein